MRAAVTGASGHLAANLIPQLVDAGHDVRAVTVEPLDRDVPGLQGLDVERVQADITDASEINRALRGVEVGFHLAAKISITDRDAAAVREVNVGGTRKVAEACLANGVRRLVYTSSIAAIDPTPRRAVHEEGASSDDHEGSAYARSKSMAEDVVRGAVDRGLDAVILNPTSMVGPRDFGPSLMGAQLLDLWSGRLPTLFRGGTNIVDVRDVARSMVAAIVRGQCGERYLVGGHWLSFLEIADLSAALFSTRVPRFVMPTWAVRTAARVADIYSAVAKRPMRLTSRSVEALSQHRLVLSTRAMEVLGHAPRPTEETLTDTYRWFVDAGMLAATHPVVS